MTTTFEGKHVDAISDKVTGDVGDEMVNEELHVGQEVVVIVVGTVTQVNHKRVEKKDDVRLERIQTITAHNGYLVDHDAVGELLHDLALERKAARDAAAGIGSLPV